MKNLIIRFFVILVFSFFIIFSNAQSLPQQKGGNYLFVESATKGVLIPEKKQPGNYKLVLKDVHPNVVYFTDRPNRVTGLISTNKFVQLWNQRGTNSFLQDSPNVGIHGTRIHWLFNEKDISVVMELSNPIYNAKSGVLTYDAKILSAGENKIPVHRLRMDHVSLFFDNLAVCPSCCVDC